MKYIVWKPFSGMTISGNVELKISAGCESKNGVIMYQGKPLCRESSFNAHQYFARDDDSNGMERGKLTQNIMAALRDVDGGEARWAKVWEDETCNRYKRLDQGEYWLWGHNFFTAPIEDLRYIAQLVQAEGI